MKHFYSCLFCFILLFALSPLSTYAQIYPVNAVTQLVPPYSVYLTDYATAGNDKLRVILLQRDLSEPQYQLRLQLEVALNGKVIMRTTKAYNPPPITVAPGSPVVIAGAELESYLDSRNLDFIGYSRDLYERSKALPEGAYTITFKAYDYQRQDVQVSNDGSTFYYLSKNEPPIINLPLCGSQQPVREPQQLIFQWLPRNTAFYNSALTTEYV